MLKRPTGLLLCLILLVPCCRRAQHSKTPQAADQGCVWRIESDAGGRLYLCGTIHILREQDYPLPAGYETAYQNSSELLFELPPGSSESANLTLRMRELGTLPADARLEQLLNPDDWKKVCAWAEKRGLGSSLLNRYHPWFVSLMMVAVEYQALGAGAEHGVDKHFEQRASKDGKPGAGLETIEQQLALFSGMTPAQELDVLQQTIAELESVGEEYEKMIQAWRLGDLESLQTMLFREAARHPELMEMFLIRRNQAWAPRLAEMLNEGRQVMVLVGAGHLGGEEGLLSLLAKEGHQATQL